MDGDLRRFINADQIYHFPFKLKSKICVDIIESIISMHKKDVVHNDIKPENILLKRIASSNDFTVRISDFGCAHKVRKEVSFSEIKGITCLYASPEYYLSSLETEASSNSIYQPDLKNDIWAFGLILHELFFGKFDDKIPHLKMIEELTKKEDIDKFKTSIYDNNYSNLLSFDDSPKNQRNENYRI